MSHPHNSKRLNHGTTDISSRAKEMLMTCLSNLSFCFKLSDEMINAHKHPLNSPVNKKYRTRWLRYFHILYYITF